MPTISRTISNADAQRLIDAYCGIYNYSDTITDPNNPINQIPNPETRSQFADRMLTKRAFKEVVKTWETRVATLTADNAPEIDVT